MKEEKKNQKWEIIAFVVVLIVLIVAIIFVIIKNITKEVEGNKNEAIVVPTVLYFDNVIGSEVEKGTRIEAKGFFTYVGVKDYYFKAGAYDENTKIVETNCTKVDVSKYSTVKFNVNKSGMYAKWTIYSDSVCKRKVIDYKTREYEVKGSSTSTNKTFKATFDKNGATSIGSSSLSCNTTGSSCTVKAPSIKRDGYTIVGWNTSKNATTAQYKVGSTITLTKNTTFYAITKKNTTGSSSSGTTTTKTFKATFDKNGATSIGSSSLSCNTTGSSCTVKAPSIKRDGYTIVGWNTSKNATTAQYKVGSTITLTKNTTFYAITKKNTTSGSSSSSSSSSKAKNGIAYSKKVNGTTVYVENGCSSSIVNKYIADIQANPSYLVQAGNIYILTKNSFNSYYGTQNAIGMTSGFAMLWASDIRCDSYYDGVVAHELAHGMDGYYAFLKGKGRISARREFTQLYNKYYKKILTDYAFDEGTDEFFAEAYAFYFGKYISKPSKELSGYRQNYPGELKTLMEQTLKEMSQVNW